MKSDEARTRVYAMPVAQPAAEPTTPQQAQSSPLVESGPFVIEGVITETHFAYGRVNLLEGILKGHKEQGLVTGIAGVLGDMYGQVANSAMVAMYDGEDTQNFICQIGEHVVCGQFAGSDKLQVGRKVRAVVTRRGDMLFAKAIVSPSQGFLWLGYSSGSKAEKMYNVRVALGMWGWGMGICYVMTLFIRREMAFSLFMLSMAVVSLLLVFCVTLWNPPMAGAAEETDQSLRMLGFAEPENAALLSYMFDIFLLRLSRELRLTGVSVGTPYVEASRGRNTFYYVQAILDSKLAWENGNEPDASFGPLEPLDVRDFAQPITPEKAT